MEINKIFTKIASNGKCFYLSTVWSNQYSDVKLYLSDGGICYSGSVSAKDFETFALQVKYNVHDYWNLSMSIWNSDACERNDIEVKLGDSSVTFIWKKVLTDCPIKQRLGSINMNMSKQDEKAVGGNLFLDSLLGFVDEQKLIINNLKQQKDDLNSKYQSALKQLDELANIKEDIEKNLYSKFVLVLNQKKEKIRQLKAQCDKESRLPVDFNDVNQQSKEKPESKVKGRTRGNSKNSRNMKNTSDAEFEEATNRTKVGSKRSRKAAPKKIISKELKRQVHARGTNFSDEDTASDTDSEKMSIDSGEREMPKRFKNISEDEDAKNLSDAETASEAESGKSMDGLNQVSTTTDEQNLFQHLSVHTGGDFIKSENSSETASDTDPIIPNKRLKQSDIQTVVVNSRLSNYEEIRVKSEETISKEAHHSGKSIPEKKKPSNNNDDMLDFSKFIDDLI